MKRLVLAATLLVLLRPDDADACTCAPDGYQAWPADGATGVPLNAAIIVAHDVGDPQIALRTAGSAQPLALALEPRGTPSLNGRFVLARPPRLEPDTTYELAITVYDVETVTTFTTGTAEDLAPPVVALRAFAPETMPYPIRGADGNYCYDSCVEPVGERVARMHVDIEASADTVLAALRVGEHELAADVGASTVGFHTCGVRAPAFVPRERYAAQAVAFDQAGNVAVSDPVDATARACAPRLHATERCAPADDCLDAPATPPVDDPQPLPNAGCRASTGSTGHALALLVALVGLARLVSRRRRRDTLAPCMGSSVL